MPLLARYMPQPSPTHYNVQLNLQRTVVNSAGQRVGPGTVYNHFSTQADALNDVAAHRTGTVIAPTGGYSGASSFTAAATSTPNHGLPTTATGWWKVTGTRRAANGYFPSWKFNDPVLAARCRDATGGQVTQTDPPGSAWLHVANPAGPTYS